MKVFFFKKKVFAFVFAILAFYIAASAVILSQDKTEETMKTTRKLPIYNVATEEKKAALSFDAAWGNEDTQNLIDILGKYNVKATFFVVGEWVDKYPESVKALHDAGHDIMNHSDTHPYLTKISKDKMINEIENCNKKIESITGIKPSLIRPPYGDYNDSVIETIEGLNMFGIQWDVDSLDWMDKTADEIYNKVTKNVKNGSIVLFHNAARHTPEALPRVIEKLQSDGFDLVKINDLIYKENYEMDHTGKQIKLS